MRRLYLIARNLMVLFLHLYMPLNIARIGKYPDPLRPAPTTPKLKDAIY